MALVAGASNHFFPSSHQPANSVTSPPRSRTSRSRSSTNPARSARSQESTQSRPSRSPDPGRDMVSRKGSRGSRAEQEKPHSEEHREGRRTEDDVQESRSSQSHDDPEDGMETGLPDRRDTQTSPSASTASILSASGTQSSVSEAPQRIKIRDLAHIQAMASPETPGRLSGQSSGDIAPQYEISAMPIDNIIEMVAGLLTKITTTNDVQHEHFHRQMPHPEGSAAISQQTSSVLAFHGKNVPSITILSYLNRINKYCPTSYEVFLSLLVYFDRMTEKVNSGPMQDMREANSHATRSHDKLSSMAEEPSPMEDVRQTDSLQTATPPMSGELSKKDLQGEAVPGTPHSRSFGPESPTFQQPQTSGAMTEPDMNLSHFFVVDSFNIHRLVIAGVTCASKFFSDIFYTNSRYAKVGGLPLVELNHLEMQFLLLNDFRLSVPVEELEAYGTTLVEFYAREVLAQNQSAEDTPQSSRSRPVSVQAAG